VCSKTKEKQIMKRRRSIGLSVGLVIVIALALATATTAARTAGRHSSSAAEQVRTTERTTGSTLPGGPAPKALTGTWRTTLTAADLQRLKAPGESHRTWALVIVNAKYLSYPHALGLGPANSGRDTVPFGVTGNKLYLACLADDGTPTHGFATYTWRLAGGALRFARVSEPCRDPILRDRIVILTSHPWRKA
jgi:hypothetical protein